MTNFKFKKIFFPTLCILFATSCTKEYITNEYITNENIYNSQYYLDHKMEEVKDDIRPKYLKKGDTVAIFAASSIVSESELSNGISTLKSWGLNVIIASNTYKADGNYAGTQSERIIGTQEVLNNPNIRAVIAARGGYGATEVGSYLDWTKFKQSPKWLVGFSDVTYFHAILNNMGIETIHGAMAKDFSDETSVTTLKNALFGELKSHSITTNSNCIEGKAEGRLVGGNLSLIYSLAGTLFDLNVQNAILLIEDTGEKYYHIDRMMYNLKQSGKLDCIKGVIIGDFTNATQGSEQSLPEIMKGHLEPLGIPVIYGMNIGHAKTNLAVYLGRQVTIDVNSKNASVTFQE